MTSRMWLLSLGILFFGITIGLAVYHVFLVPPTEEVPPAWQPTPTAPSRVATLDIDIADRNFANFSGVVDANGSVATETAKTTTIYINNTDTEDAKDVVITLKNPITEKEGLPSALQRDEFEVWVIIGTGYSTISKPLFEDGEFKDFEYGTIQADEHVTLTLKVVMKEAPEGTFSPDTTYDDCELYIVQGNAGYDIVQFSVIT